MVLLRLAATCGKHLCCCMYSLKPRKVLTVVIMFTVGYYG
jgi:hypothetical protein